MRYLPFLKRLHAPAVGAVLLIAATGCVGNPPPAVEGTIWVSTAPPHPIHEVRPYRPGPEFIWIEGYHRWTGVDYVWVAGHWERPPRPRARWERGRWYHADRGWYWIDGRWRDRDEERGHGHGHGRGHDDD